MDTEDEEDEQEEAIEENMELSQEIQDAYGAPEPDAKHNQYTYLHKASFDSDDTVRTTFLHEGELGRPLFTVRFLLDLYKMAMYDDLDKIAAYYREKVQNITHSGMSNKGFAMTLNVTQRKDVQKKRMRDNSNLKNQKGGENVT